MSIEAVLQKAGELGITLKVDGDFIEYSPKSATPPDFVETLRQHKPEILAHFRHVDSYVDVDLPGVWIEATDAVAITCHVCGANEWWPRHDGVWTCSRCHPEPPDGSMRMKGFPGR